jgi:hypothetical protein
MNGMSALGHKRTMRQLELSASRARQLVHAARDHTHGGNGLAQLRYEVKRR